MTKTILSKKIQAILQGRVLKEHEKLLVDELVKLYPMSAFKEKEAPNPDVPEVIRTFKELHLKYIGSNVDINYSRDTIRIKEILKTKTKEEVLSVAKWALTTDSLKRECTTIPYILNSFVFTNYYKYRKENGYKD